MVTKMQYVNNGLRALGRGAVVGAAALTLVLPALAQEIPFAQVQRGWYLTENARCFVDNRDKKNTSVQCVTFYFRTTTENGQLESYAIAGSVDPSIPPRHVDSFFGWNYPVKVFAGRIDDEEMAVRLYSHSATTPKVASESPPAESMKRIHDLVANDIIKAENFVGNTAEDLFNAMKRRGIK